jgi:hypothetical protein
MDGNVVSVRRARPADDPGAAGFIDIAANRWHCRNNGDGDSASLRCHQVPLPDGRAC